MIRIHRLWQETKDELRVKTEELEEERERSEELRDKIRELQELRRQFAKTEVRESLSFSLCLCLRN